MMNAVKRTMTGCLERFFSGSCRLSVFLFVLVFSSSSYSACTDWIARVVSIQGSVDVRVINTADWKPVALQQTYCSGDTIRVQANSRAALELHNDTILRLNQNSTLVLSGPKKEASWLDLLKGSLHSISRVPRSLKIKTPFVNAAVEGTEFLVQVSSDNTLVGVIEGKVAVANEYGRILLAKDQSAITYKGKAPVLRLDIRPADSVQWSLYYPSLNVAALKPAEDLLRVGQVDAAEKMLAGQSNVEALALRSVIALAKNDKETALKFSAQAVQMDSASVVANLARSYAFQSRFDLQSAKLFAQKAVQLQPGHAIAWARLAELHLSLGELAQGLDAATRSSELEPTLARTQTILGFAYLMKSESVNARQAFVHALRLDSTDPLTRFGLGLTDIREGNIKQGRRNIELAASLDPNNSLIRSYLGKAYYEEKRSKLAADQFLLAKEMDPKDPTPLYYDAIRQLADNQPVGAMLDLQQSIQLNDNRAVYRSRQLLDQDHAARSASVARIYQTLGFEQVALQDGWKSINIDPTSHSAHRFLADSYARLPRHEIARVSELLQSQLLQPLNSNPIQPQLAESNLGILDGAGPSTLATSEYNPLFTRDGTVIQLNALAGSDGTVGNDLSVSGIHDVIAYSIGQFHYETDGFRLNNDLKQDIYNAFIQGSVTQNTSIQGEYRYRDTSHGDLALKFEPDNFSDSQRNDRTTKLGRLGLHHRFSSNTDLLMSLVYKDLSRQQKTPFFEQQSIPFLVTREGFDANSTDSETFTSELQFLMRTDRFNYVIGAGNVDEDRKDTTAFFDVTTAPAVFPMPIVTDTLTTEDVDASYTNAYIYSQLELPSDTTLTLGAAYDKLSSSDYDSDDINPKLGLAWSPRQGSTVRLAYFEGVGRPINAEQTIEPTQVAGFNQFFDDIAGAQTKRYGIAFEQQFTPKVFSGVELSWREQDAPVSATGFGAAIDKRDETLHRAYAYWAPTRQLALSAEYFFEDQEGQLVTPLKLKTQRAPLGVRYFWQGGNFASLTGTYVDQEFTDSGVLKQDDFWVVDATVGLRLPRRQGRFQLIVKNLFDQNFNYFDPDLQGLARGARNPAFIPERQIFAQFTYVFH